MTGSLLLVLAVNALARELTGRYPVGEVLFYRFFGAAWLVAILSGREMARALCTPRLKLHLVRVGFGVSATLALYLATQHLPFADQLKLDIANLGVGAGFWNGFAGYDFTRLRGLRR